MTWYYQKSNDSQTIDVYEDDAEFTGLVTTLTHGPPWDYPDDIKQVMREAWEQEANLGNSPVMNVRAGYILMDMVQENIEEGTP